MMFPWGSKGGIFTDDQAVFGQIFKQVLIFHWIDPIDPTSDDTDRIALCDHGFMMSDSIDAFRQSADNDELTVAVSDD
jgi:hypothetical protein